jgi:hypothetical protein
MGTTSDAQQFSVEVRDDYIHLRTWGGLDEHQLDAPANAALELAARAHVEKLLDDIRDIDTTGVSIPIQAKAMSILWKLRVFKRVAIVLNGSRIENLFLSTIQGIGLHLEDKFRAFNDEADAIAWLEDAK